MNNKAVLGTLSDFKAIIFDMDGVISDTQKHHSAIESELLGSVGIAITPAEITEKYSGVHTLHFFTELTKDPALAQKLIGKKWDMMKHLVIAKGIDPIAGIHEVLSYLKEKEVPLAVASASPISFISVVLSSLGITDMFKVITSAEEVSKGKPAPDIFLLAAQRLGINPKDCVVIEDGMSGMVGARAAGMRCIAYVPLATEYPVDLVTSRMSDLLEK